MSRTKTKAAQPALFQEEQSSGTVPAKQNTTKPKGTAVAKAEPRRQTNLMAVFASAAADPNCDTQKMRELKDMMSDLKREEAEVAFVEAYIDMQQELPSIDADGKIEIAAKSSSSKAQNTPYAKYPAIMKVVKPILKRYRFMLITVSEPNPSGVGVVVRGTLSRVHETQYGKAVFTKQTVIAAPLETSGSKNNVQGVGSSLSYCKRYAVIQLLNIISRAPMDDDNDGAGPKPRRIARAAASEPGDETEDDGAVQKISGSQEKTLLAAITDCGVRSETFLKYWKIEAVKDLPMVDFDEAIQSCKTYAANHPKKNG